MNFSIERRNDGSIVWSDDQMAYVVDLYVNQRSTIASIANLFNCSSDAVRRLLRKNKVELQGQKLRFPRNSEYFNNIDTAEKAYWLGFLYADGCVHTTGNTISINITDLEHVEKFRRALGSNNKITTTIDKRFENAKPLYQFAIRDKQLYNDLIKWGCTPQKTTLLTKIPNIPRDYVSHFIRGYFDGDGSLHYLQGTDNFRISFVGQEDFLKDIQKELDITKLSLDAGKGCYQLQISGRKQIERILTYLYKDSTSITRLDRKYNSYLDCLNWAHRH